MTADLAGASTATLAKPFDFIEWRHLFALCLRDLVRDVGVDSVSVHVYELAWEERRVARVKFLATICSIQRMAARDGDEDDDADHMSRAEAGAGAEANEEDPSRAIVSKSQTNHKSRNQNRSRSRSMRVRVRIFRV